jgi:predicted glutamine amidotransferase
MCRIMFSLVDEKNKHFTKDTYRYLEKNLGGDGNGIALNRDNALTVTKGVSLTTEMCAEIASRGDSGLPVLFHTRRQSHGALTTMNCQPFFTDKNKVIVQNGTWTDIDEARKFWFFTKSKKYKNMPSDWSDARLIAKMISDYGVEVLERIDTGNYIIYEHGKTYAMMYKYSHTFEAVFNKGRWYYASDFPQTFKKHYSFFGDCIAKIDVNEGITLIKGCVIDVNSKAIFMEEDTCLPMVEEPADDEVITITADDEKKMVKQKVALRVREPDPELAKIINGITSTSTTDTTYNKRAPKGMAAKFLNGLNYVAWKQYVISQGLSTVEYASAMNSWGCFPQSEIEPIIEKIHPSFDTSMYITKHALTYKHVSDILHVKMADLYHYAHWQRRGNNNPYSRVIIFNQMKIPIIIIYSTYDDKLNVT